MRHITDPELGSKIPDLSAFKTVKISGKKWQIMEVKLQDDDVNRLALSLSTHFDLEELYLSSMYRDTVHHDLASQHVIHS